MASRYHVRSISLPSRSHPSTLRAEEELNKLKAWEATLPSTSGSICRGLSCLEELYMAMDDLINMPSTLQILSRGQNKRCIEESLDGSVKILDVCGVSMDILLQMKENIQSLQSAFRRRKGDSSVESSIAQYICLRKKMKKEAKKVMTVSQQMDNYKFEALPLSDEDDHLSALVRVLKEVTSMAMAVFHSTLSFLAVPDSKSKASRWTLVAKLLNVRVVACEEDSENVNELHTVDAAFSSFRKYNSTEKMNKDSDQKIQAAQKKLQALENSIAPFESRLDSLFRCIIRSRASLLNVISH